MMGAFAPITNKKCFCSRLAVFTPALIPLLILQTGCFGLGA